MRIVRTFLSLLALVSTLVEGRSATGQRVLVIVEHAINRADHSRFFESLQARGFELTFKGPKEETHQLVEYGERNFDHLILMAPSTTSWADHLLPTHLLPSLLSSGINTLFLSTSQQSNSLTELYREFDLEFSAPGTGLLTHVPSSKRNGKGNSAVSFPLSSGLHKETPLSIIPDRVRESKKHLVGGGLTHTPGRLHPFVIPVLHAPLGGFSGSLEGDAQANMNTNAGRGVAKQVMMGEEAGLVSVFQSRNNVRFGWAGLGMVDDEVFSAETLNPEFIDALTSWIFQETGVVKVLSTEHYRTRGNVTESRDRFKGYTFRDEVTYEMVLAQHDPSSSNTSSSSSWVPMEIPDLQLDFTMLDPHIRGSIPYAGEVTTEQGHRAGLHRKTFTAPDKHGVFKFVVDWWRPGYSFIHESTLTSVIPPRHDEHARFIPGATPFYAGAFLVPGAFLVFCYLWLQLGGVEGDKVGREREGKKQK